MSVRYISFVGRSGCGKTTLITRLLPIFEKRDLKIGTIKHTHHQAEFDKPGKDSWQHRKSGSQQTLVMSHNQMALYAGRSPEMSLEDAVHRWFGDFDLVISEGFKNEPGIKIEVYREATGKEPLYADPAYKIQALVSDVNPGLSIPCFGFEALEPICNWILRSTGLDVEQAGRI